MPSNAVPDAAVRDATEADLPRIVELLQQLSLEAPREAVTSPLPEGYRAAFREIEADPRQRLLVVEAGGQIVGTVVFIVVPNLSHEGQPYALLENLVVDETQRGSGYGELLMRFAMAEAERLGCYRLSLNSNKQREGAHRFYRGLGFRTRHKAFGITFD